MEKVIGSNIILTAARISATQSGTDGVNSKSCGSPNMGFTS